MATMRVRQVFRRSDLAIAAVERVALRHRSSEAGCLVQGEVEPVAIVVCSGDHVYALDMEAQALDLEQLKQDAPDVDSFIGQ